MVRRSDGSRRSLGLLACDAVWSRSDNCVYYVRTSAPDTLAKLSLTTLTASTACQAAGPIQYLRVGINGLLAEVGRGGVPVHPRHQAPGGARRIGIGAAAVLRGAL